MKYIKYIAKECSCWAIYPNKAYKRSNGQWKCVDCYKRVRVGDHYKVKTKCVLVDKESEVQNDA